MTSSVFETMVSALAGTSLEKNARNILEDHTKAIGKKPQELTRDDGSLVAMTLMSSISDVLSREEWEAVDSRIKNILFDENRIKGKVRGIVLANSLDYISFKRGRKALEEIQDAMRINSKFRVEAWYPLDYFEEFLETSDRIMGPSNVSRASGMGEYIVTRNMLWGAHWFGPGKPLRDAVENLSELFVLDNFVVKQPVNECIECGFDYDDKCHITQFIYGLCKGLIKMRDAEKIRTRIENGGQMTKIVFNIESGGM